MWLDPATRLGVLAAAGAIEWAAGYPDPVYRVIGHPVTWIGALIGWLDARLNPSSGAARHLLPKGEGSSGSNPSPSGRGMRDSVAEGLNFTQPRRFLGVFALLVVLVTTIAVSYAVQTAFASSWRGLALLTILASTLIATRSLHSHVLAVADALESGGLSGGRSAVSRIVGRDPEALDEAGVCRAAIESLAENFSDGVVAPALWFAVAGLPGLVTYKAINTADSMIGHHTPRHEAFGWASARLDDVVNLPASRLSAALIALAATVLPGASAGESLRAVRRDAVTHRSPNAGWPEAAVAGALGLRLAGPRSYHGVMTPGTPMGSGREEATATDIRRALRLYRLAAGIGWAVIATAAVVLGAG